MKYTKEITVYRTCVCNINYHIVFSTKYRRKVLNQEVENTLQEIINQIAKEKESISGEILETYQVKSKLSFVKEKYLEENGLYKCTSIKPISSFKSSITSFIVSHTEPIATIIFLAFSDP